MEVSQVPLVNASVEPPKSERGIIFIQVVVVGEGGIGMSNGEKFENCDCVDISLCCYTVRL